jgi:hypothetical protein
MESEWEKEIRELLDSLAREPLDELLKEIAEAPIPFIDYEPIPKARRTRKKANENKTKGRRSRSK